MRGRFRGGAAIALLLLLAGGAAACADDGGAGPTASGLGLRGIDVDGGDDGFRLGPSTASALVPVLLRDEDRVSVRLVDVAGGRAIDAGSPTRAPVGDATVAMSDDWVVVATTECTGAVVEVDTGFECDEEGPRAVVLAAPVGDDPAWTEVDVDLSAGPAWIVGVTGDRVVLRLPAAEGGTLRPQVRVDLATGTAEEVAAFDPGTPRCSFEDAPAVTFPTSVRPTEAILPGDATTVALPDAIAPLTDLFCWSAGSWIVVDAELYDLRRPDAAPVDLGDGDQLGALHAAGDAWAAVFGEEVVVQPPAAGDRRAVITGTETQNVELVAGGVVMAAFDDDGALEGLWAAAFG